LHIAVILKNNKLKPEITPVFAFSESDYIKILYKIKKKYIFLVKKQKMSIKTGLKKYKKTK
jgi:hypothetical protein